MHTDTITLTLRKQGRNMTWLARRMGMTRRTIYRRLQDGFSEDERQRISDILDVPPELLFDDLPAVYHAVNGA